MASQRGTSQAGARPRDVRDFASPWTGCAPLLPPVSDVAPPSSLRRALLYDSEGSHDYSRCNTPRRIYTDSLTHAHIHTHTHTHSGNAGWTDGCLTLSISRAKGLGCLLHTKRASVRNSDTDTHTHTHTFPKVDAVLELASPSRSACTSARQRPAQPSPAPASQPPRAQIRRAYWIDEWRFLGRDAKRKEGDFGAG